MRYLMKQKLFSFGDDFTIKDEAGVDHYFVDGKAFSIGAKLSFQDMSGAELAFIKQRVLKLKPTYEIHRNGQVAAIVTKDLFTLFNCRFHVDVPGPDDLEASGNFTDHEYAFTRGDRQVAAVSKQWFTLRDTYGVNIADGEDEVLVLASTVVIDMACHPDDRRR
ncbi:MAG: LURP-one-related/scramblase family protein [Gemmatimonadaceae bacterium]